MSDNNSPKVGDRVTVLTWVGTNDNSFKGDVMEVVAVDVPFIVVNRHTRYTVRPDRLSLDLRRVVLKPLSMEYVAEMLTNEAKP